MAIFFLAVQCVLNDEKGYVNDLNDPGGETKYGISKRQYPDEDISNLTLARATEIYQKDYWQKEFELIHSQSVINKMFSVGVDTGMHHAALCLQRAVRAVNGTILDLDGVFGQISIKEINSCDQSVLLPVLKAELAAYYRTINNSHEMKGWENRAYE